MLHTCVIVSMHAANLGMVSRKMYCKIFYELYMGESTHYLLECVHRLLYLYCRKDFLSYVVITITCMVKNIGIEIQVDKKVSILKVAPIFCCLNDEELAELSAYTHLYSYKPGEYIFWEGDPPLCFCIIARGRVKLLNHSSAGREFTIAFLSNYEMFGEIAVLKNINYPSSAQAVEYTDVLRIKGEDFLSFLSKHPQLDLRIISVLVERLREAQLRLKDIAGERVEQRIARILFMLAEKSGTELLYTRQEIAELVGTTTETTIRVIVRFKEMGVLDTIRGKITILNMEKLKLLSEGPPRV